MDLKKAFLFFAVGSIAVLPAMAQPGEQSEYVDEDDPSRGPLNLRGGVRVEDAIGQRGAIMELRNGARLFIPPSLPIGHSRVLRFSTARRAPRPAQIGEGFVRHGPALEFNGQLNATSNPIEVSVRATRLRVRNGHRVVLAMEQAGLCDDSNRRHSLGSGLCSTWEIVEATHDADQRRVSARLPLTGGFRLQFGTLPAE